jgi:hypothetical protein
MERTNPITCPSCGKPLKVPRGIRIGQKIKCVRCAGAFTVRPRDADQGGGVNGARLAVVLAWALVYLLCGAGLAGYCFTHNAPANKGPQARTETSEKEEDGDEPVAPPKAPTPPKRGAVSPAQQRQIDRAIADGVWYLKDHIHADGSWDNTVQKIPDLSVGFAALPGLTLLECGVPASDPVVKKAADLVRKEAAHLTGIRYATYQISLAILFLDRLGDPRDKTLIQHLALCLIAGQRADGGWYYGCPPVDPKEVPRLLTLLRDPKLSLADWHKAASKGGAFPAGGWDNSNTQFAVLALWVGQRHQVAIDKPIELAVKHFRTTQLHGPKGAAIPDPNNVNLDGSWHYNATINSSRWPSMTCSGLLGLAIGHGIARNPKEQNQKPLDDPAIKAGLAMLAREIDRPGEKRPRDHYFLWSMARVAVLYDLDTIGGKDWYAWGVRAILPNQKKDGSWTDGAYIANHPVLNTCFALLFLQRANLARDLTDKLQLLSAGK